MPEGLFSGRYQIESELGRGGMGVVYLAHDLLHKRPVALKVIRPDVKDEVFIHRFRREAQYLSRLHHPNIASIYDMDLDAEDAFFVMEYIEGRTILQVVKESPDRLKTALDLTRQVCAALEHAHAQEIVHRDLKPENLLVTKDGVVKVMDFGLARRLTDQTELTASGQMLGTVSYISPEQALGTRLDPRADLYSLGVILYELIADRLPFEGEDPVSVVIKHVSETPNSPRVFNPQIPESLERIILKLMAKDPGERYQSVGSLMEDLDRVKLGEPHLETLEPGHPGLVKVCMTYALVGREKEIANLRTLLDKSIQAEPQVAILRGEVGTGKTRLVHDLGGFAAVKGVKFFSGSSTIAHKPYEPFLEMLEQMKSQDLPSYQTLSREIFDPLEAAIGKPGMEGLRPRERTEFFARINRFFRSFIERKPGILFFDNLERADGSTLDLLAQFLTGLGTIPLMVLLAIDGESEVETQELAAFLKAVKKTGKCSVVHLKPLSASETGTLIFQILGGQMDPESLEFIHHKTGGNPLFVIEFVQTLKEKGQIRREGDLLVLQEEGKKLVPSGVCDLLLSKMEGLKQDVVEVLAVASCIGESFDLASLCGIIGRKREEIDEALGSCIEKDLIREAWLSGGERFNFSSPLLQEAIWEKLSPRQKKHLHHRIAEFLEESAPESRILDIARHYALAQEQEKSLRYNLLAARKTKSIFALRESLKFWETLQRTLEGQKDRDDDLWLEVMIGKSTINSALGNWEIAGQDLNEAIARAEETGRWIHAAKACRHLGSAEYRRGEFDEAIGLCEKGLSVLERADSQDEEAMREKVAILSYLEHVCWRKRDMEKTLQYSNLAMEIAGKLMDMPTLITLYMDQGMRLKEQGDAPGALTSYTRSLQMARELKDQEAIVSNLNNIAGVYVDLLLQWDKALEHYAEALKIARNLHYRSWISAIQGNMACVYYALGDWEKAILYLEGTLAIQKEMEALQQMAHTLANLAEAYLEEGSIEKAEGCLRESHEIALREGDRFVQHLALKGLAVVERHKGNRDFARDYLEKAKTLAKEMNYFPGLAAVELHLGEVACDEGALEEASALAEESRRLSEAIGEKAGMASALCLLGAIAHKGGKKGEARAKMGEAFRILEPLNCPYPLAKARMQLGEMLLDEGQDAEKESIAHLESALEIFNRIGAVNDAARARYLLRKMIT